MRRPLMPWQQHAADVALEIDPATGELWYEEVVITVPRQSGKTTLILALLIWRCIVMARRLGPQVCTYLAQSGKMARRKLEREFIPTLRRTPTLREVPHSRARPRAANEWKPSMNNGSEHVLFGTDSYLQIEAPTGTGSHGDVLDMPVIDEAFAREDDLVEQAVDAASVTRRSPQLYIISTAGNGRSRYLWAKVLAGRALVESGRTDTRRCYLEWGLPDDVPFDDESAWWQYLPALGHTITLQRLRAKLDKALSNPDVKVDKDDEEPGLAGFRRGYLNQWVETPVLGEAAFIPEIDGDDWAALGICGRGMASSDIDGDITIGVSVAPDGVSSSIALAGRTTAGLLHVELFDVMAGTWWLERRLRDLCAKWQPRAVGWDHNGPTRAVSPELIRGSQGHLTMPLSGREWTAACEAARNAVTERRLVHLDDPMLDAAVAGATRRTIGRDAWEWDLHSAHADITPLRAATAALRALETAPEPEREQKRDLRIW